MLIVDLRFTDKDQYVVFFSFMDELRHTTEMEI